HRHPVEQAVRLAAPPPLLRGPGLLQGLVGGDADERVQLRLDLLGPAQRGPGGLHGAELAPAVAVEQFHGGQLGELGHPPSRERQCPGTYPRCLSTTFTRGCPASQRSYNWMNCCASSSRQPTVSPLMCGDTIRPGTSHSGLAGSSGSEAKTSRAAAVIQRRRSASAS